MSADALLSRLDRVRKTGPNRWIARCPAHDDKSPSLSIRETEDGRILLHDFAGCDTASVLAAIDLSLSDLFPDRLDHNVKPTHSKVPLRDLVPMIDHESLVVFMIASDVVNGKKINDESLARLRMAVQRIGAARDELA